MTMFRLPTFIHGRPKTSNDSTRSLGLRKNPCATFVTLGNATIAMPLSSAMAATWQCIKVGRYFAIFLSWIRMLWCTLYPRGSMALPEVHALSRKTSGTKSSTILTLHHRRIVSFVPTAVVPLSRLPQTSGHICFVPFGFQRWLSPTRFTWNRSTTLVEFQRVVGNW